MKNIFLIFLFLLGNCFFFSLCDVSYAAKTNEQLDQIVAIVNDDVVTRSELTHSLALIKLQMTESHMALPASAILRQQVLDQLINKKLQLQIAQQAGIKMTDKDVDQFIQRIADQNQVSTQTLYARLTQEGMSVSDYRKEMREQLILQKLQQQEVISHVTVSPDEITAYMHSDMWHNTNTNANEYRIDDILIALPDTPSSQQIADAKQKAQQMMAELQQGKKITQPVQETDLGWRKLAEIPNEYADQVINMKAKQIVGPIQTANGFHILKLTDLRSNNNLEADRKQVESVLLQRKFEEAIKTWISKLRAQAFIKITSNTVQA
jgi:peptidyl-prolyl cis-trans isomerase SurA